MESSFVFWNRGLCSNRTTGCFPALAAQWPSHSHCSVSEGIPLPAVSARLGHADTSITARIYSHALPQDDARAAEASHAQRRIRELEDELTAAREGLRRVIRQTNR